MGHSASNAQGLRKAKAYPARPRHDHAPANPRQRGGQARIGLFGILGCDRARLADARRQQARQATTPAKVASEVKAPTTSVALAPLVGESVAAHQRRQDRAAAARCTPETQIDKLKAYFARKDAARDAIRDVALFEDEPKATGQQQLIAHASDMREAFPHVQDDEHAEFLHRCAGTGYVEATLAREGN